VAIAGDDFISTQTHKKGHQGMNLRIQCFVIPVIAGLKAARRNQLSEGNGGMGHEKKSEMKNQKITVCLQRNWRKQGG
jgi:hypothetical protein